MGRESRYPHIAFTRRMFAGYDTREILRTMPEWPQSKEEVSECLAL